MLLYNKEMKKFSYNERMASGAATDPEDKEIRDRQFKVNFEEIGGVDLKNYDPKVFSQFEQECLQRLDLKEYIEYSGGHDKGDRAGFGTELTPAYSGYKYGDFYCGGWLKGFRHGVGICFYADGSVYKGAWNEGEWCGGGPAALGMLKTVSGEILLGIFTGQNGQLKDLSNA